VEGLIAVLCKLCFFFILSLRCEDSICASKHVHSTPYLSEYIYISAPQVGVTVPKGARSIQIVCLKKASAFSVPLFLP
jgi:hypothetical protein